MPGPEPIKPQGVRTEGPLEERRVPFDQAVSLRYPLFQEFIEEESANISMGGMFIRTLHPRPPGSKFHFEFRLEDGFTLVDGECEVAWVRERSAGPGRPEGMGVRFLDLDLKSYKLIRTIVEQRLQRGDAIFDLERDAPRPGKEAADEGRASAAGGGAAAAAPPRAPSAGATSRTSTAAAEGPAPAAPAAAGGPEKPAPPAGSSAGAEAAPPEPAPSEIASASAAPPPPAPSHPPPGVIVPPMPSAATGSRDRAAPAGAPAASPENRPRREFSGPIRLVALALLSAGIGGLAVLLFQQAYVEPAIEVLEPVEELTARPAAPAPASGAAGAAGDEAAGAGPAAAPAGEPGAGPAEVPGAAVEPPDARERIDPDAAPGALSSGETAMAWAAAWSAQDVERYLSFYSADFRPADGKSRDEWEQMRRVRVSRPEHIEVRVLLLVSEDVGPDEAKVSFVQVYESDRFADRVRKTLRMVREAGGWKIAEERVER